ncbi:MAG: hypothetical protein EBY30_11255 [Rhodospirillales bacterium]|nr:hypothetical protein [Rhodospirillales bacterium]
MYSAQADALRNLLTAMDAMEDFELVIHTAQTPQNLAEQGLQGPGLRARPHLPHGEALAAQKAADILFLPLAFDSAIPEVIRSSAPAKAAEYLASGRPVLVHAPPGAYVCQLFGQGAGLVVDRPEPTALATALRRIRDEAGLRQSMAIAALRLAGDFRVTDNRARLLAALVRGRG